MSDRDVELKTGETPEHLYRLLVEERRDFAIFTLDLEGRVLTWNAGAKALFGYEEREIVGRPGHVLFTPVDVQAGVPEGEMRSALARGRAEDTRWHVRKDGSWVWVSGSLEPLHNGEVKGFAKVVRDETGRHRAEEARRRSEEMFRRVLENVRDHAVFMLDPEGRVATWNPGAERIKGWPAEEIIGRYYGILGTPSQQAEGRPEMHLKLALANGRFEEENWRMRKDGSLYWASIVIEPAYDERGQLLGFTKVVRDITERKKGEEERERLHARERAARAEAERANRAKDQFLATVSHELRTPLTAILGWATLLRHHRGDSAMLDEGLETIERNAQAQAKIVEDILDVSRIITGRLKLNVGAADVGRVVEAAVGTVRRMAEEKGVGLEVQVRPGLVVSGDGERLQQVVWNLLTNAIKFTPAGGVVRVMLAGDEMAGRQLVATSAGVEAVGSVRLVVSDTGVGIRREFLPHVFEAFRQADSSTTRRHGGLGLGLSIVKSIVEAHRGEVRAESGGEGKGATFVVTLPAGKERRDGEVGNGEVGKVALPDLSHLRVLVVDDEPDARRFVAMLLAECGAAVEQAGTVGEAMSILSDPKRVDLLVSDIGMPGEDGYGLIRRLRGLEAQSQRRPMVAVALTAYAREEDRERARVAGFDGYLAKPVEPGELAGLVERLVGRGGSGESGGR